jgi:tryptophan synthase alpha subunit
MNIELNIVSRIETLKADILSICEKYINTVCSYKTRYEFYQEIDELVASYKVKGLLHPDFQLDQYMQINLSKSGFDNCLTQTLN